MLRPEMSKAHYETWVNSTVALGWLDEGKTIFRIGCTNPYGRDWCESRIGSSITRLIEGQVNHPVTVQFEVKPGGHSL